MKKRTKAAVGIFLILTVIAILICTCGRKKNSEIASDANSGEENIVTAEPIPEEDTVDDSVLNHGLPTSYSDGDGPSDAYITETEEVEDDYFTYHEDLTFFDDAYDIVEEDVSEDSRELGGPDDKVSLNYADMVGTWEMTGAYLDREVFPIGEDEYHVTFYDDFTVDYENVAVGDGVKILLERQPVVVTDASEYYDYAVLDVDSLKYERYFVLNSDSELWCVFTAAYKDWKMPREFIGIYRKSGSDINSIENTSVLNYN